jgi:O-acetyl-ADP-ribose deacetylase (regulator of RNase III)
MPFKIIRNDLTKMKVDAIVNPTDPSYTGLGGTDQAVHQAAGPGLDAECRTLEGCLPGQVVLTNGYNLPAKHIIHTVGPIWHDGNLNEGQQLANCFKNALALAKKHKFKSIAFPLISSGTFGYPKGKALQTAIASIGEFLLVEEMMVYLVVYDSESFHLSEQLFTSIEEYIDSRYVEEHKHRGFALYQEALSTPPEQISESRVPPASQAYAPHFDLPAYAPIVKRDLNDVVNHVDETFSQMLLRLITEKGMTDAETYKKANIDRKLFSKIRSDKDYRPSKPTALAFAIALRLSLDETRDLLLRAGFALSHSSRFDLIVEFFIYNKQYNIFEINEALFYYEESLLAA